MLVGPTTAIHAREPIPVCPIYLGTLPCLDKYLPTDLGYEIGDGWLTNCWTK